MIFKLVATAKCSECGKEQSFEMDPYEVMVARMADAAESHFRSHGWKELFTKITLCRECGRKHK